MPELPAYVLVKAAVVYRLTRPMRAREEPRYLRMSVPPDAAPGKKSKFKVSYPPHRIPDHQPIERDEAERIMHASVEEFEERLRAEAADV